VSHGTASGREKTNILAGIKEQDPKGGAKVEPPDLSIYAV
jgi:hypothetical protein